MTACLWCGNPFEPRQSGGKAQRYCSASCRRGMEHSARSYALAAVDAEILTVEDLKRGPSSTPALAPSEPKPLSDPCTAPTRSLHQEAIPMNAQSAPNAAEFRSAAEMFDRVRLNAIAAQDRAEQLEDTLRLQREASDDLIVTLRGRIHTLEKQIDDRDERIHLLETNAHIRMLSTERIATIVKLLRDAIVKAAEDFVTSEVDAIERERTPEPKGEPAESDRDVIITPHNRTRLLARLADELAPATQAGDEGDEELFEQTEQTMAGEGAAPLPRFLRAVRGEQ